ncbi:MAG: glycosyltransferase family 39 protein [Phycisphaerales bacterium]|nr:glycosyltransferase family 39 protein [Phycisphaerales bacterium]
MAGSDRPVSSSNAGPSPGPTSGFDSQAPNSPPTKSALHSLSKKPSRGRAVLAVVAYAALIFLPFLGSGRTLTQHEVIVAQPAINMLQDGNWIVPRYHTDEPWVDKPPLVSWIDAALFSVLGFSEWAARLPAALSAIGLCALMTLLAWRFTDPRTALLAGLVQAVCVYSFVQGRLGEIDMPFALLIAAAHAVLLFRWGDGRTDLPFRQAALFHTLCGLAVLAKGPLAPAFIGCAVLGFCAARRSWRPLASVLFTPAVLCFFVAAGWWYVAAYARIGDLALERWSYTYVNRIAGEHVQGRQSALVYVMNIPWMLAPASIILLLGWRAVAKRVAAPQNHFERYLWCWFLFGLTPLLVSAFKAKHYAVPLLPPLSILAAMVITTHLRDWGVHARRLYAVLFIGVPVAGLVVGGIIMPKRDHRRATAEFIADVTARVPPGETLYTLGLAQSSVFPYIRCDWRGINRLSEFAEVLQRADGRPVWVLTLRGYLHAEAARELQFEELGADRPRKPHLQAQAHVFGRVVGGRLIVTEETEHELHEMAGPARGP